MSAKTSPSLWSAAELQRDLGATLAESATSLESLGMAGPSIDSRTLQRGELFFCLKAARDGHDFIEAAVRAGAGGIVCARDRAEESYATVQAIAARLAESTASAPLVFSVDDPEYALQRWASAHRRRMRPEAMIALSGSNGKTTTRRMLAAALSPLGPIHQTSGNLNNHLGLPLTLLKLRESDRFSVIELGMNAPGELRDLCAIAAPTDGVLTTIGAAHLEGLGSVEAVAAAKGELFTAIPAEGRLFFPDTLALQEIALRDAVASKVAI
ncbi:MAG: Mur ligase family protein, partial [Myxococcota bacterium]|nr:Mur ligase family protein [Myxococcota bacterium]